MKKRTRNKLLAIATAILLAAIMVVPGIGALKTYAAGSNYEKYSNSQLRPDGSNETTEIQKFLQIRNDCNIPAATFTFSAAAGTEIIPATADTLPVYEGVTPEQIKFTEVGKTTTASGTGTIVYATQKKPTTTTGADNVTVKFENPDANHYTAIKKMQLDFSAVEFPEPGVYRYIITETNSSNGAVTRDPKRRVLDVYVENDTTVTTTKKYLTITNYVLYVEETVNDINTLAPSATSVTGRTMTYEDKTTVDASGSIVNNTKIDKSLGFVNKYPSASLYFGKEVEGNQGSLDKYFEYELKIKGGTPGAILAVDYTLADQEITTEKLNRATTKITEAVPQPLTITLNDSGIATQKFYLQDGQYIVVSGFSDGAEFELKEDKEDYAQAFGIAATDSPYDYDGTSGKDAMNEGIFTDSTGIITGTFAEDTTTHEIESFYTGFTNTKEGAIPTGVILSVAPWAIAGVVILAGVVFFAIRSRKKYEEE